MLDINTPKGQRTLEQERQVASILLEMGLTYWNTNKRGDAPVDAVLTKGTNVMYVAETKCRDTDKRTLMNVWHGEWLVTYQKLLELSECSRLLRVPALGLLYLTKDPLLAVVRLTDKHGEFLPRIRIERTTTQATCNGGVANRVNAFIDMRFAHFAKP